jgi:hypothetical protein
MLHLGRDQRCQAARLAQDGVFNDGAKSQAGLFGEHIRPVGDTEAVGVRLSELQLEHLWHWDAW